MLKYIFQTGALDIAKEQKKSKKCCIQNLKINEETYELTLYVCYLLDDIEESQI